MNNIERVSIEYPAELLVSLKYRKKEFADEIKRISVIKLYELGKISSGLAAKVLGIDRVDFLELLGKYKVSIFQYGSKEEILEDVKNA